MSQIRLRQPQTPEEFEQYFELRWRILRKPWGQPKGSERDKDEDHSYHIMAVERQKIVGVARLQGVDRDMQLRYMAVDNHYQGQGIGRMIVEHMENHARQQQTQNLFLHARDNALEFYKALGYEITEKSYLLFDTIQHYKMTKKL